MGKIFMHILQYIYILYKHNDENNTSQDTILIIIHINTLHLVNKKYLSLTVNYNYISEFSKTPTIATCINWPIFVLLTSSLSLVFKIVPIFNQGHVHIPLSRNKNSMHT